MNRRYCTYITFYSGNLLPPWYIGSSYEEKILNGYNGSVASKKWKEIYLKEQKENKHLFKTRILNVYVNRHDALKEELRLQKKHKVVTNNKYFNESYANINGYFGRDVSGENNPNYGNKGTKSPLYGRKYSKEHCENISKTTKGLKRKNTQKIKEAQQNRTVEHCKNISKSLKESGVRKLSGNSQAKRINIYNNKNDLMFECYGNFKYVCKENNLPWSALANSYRNNGKQIYMKLRNNDIARYTKTGEILFRGWYAKII